MSLIKILEEKIIEIFKNESYDVDNISLNLNSKKELGQFQINDCIRLAKKRGENPLKLAEKICSLLNETNFFKNCNATNPGFVNINIKDDILIKYLNDCLDNIEINIDKHKSETIIIDYGGANVAKELHVGHLRAANIGQALYNLSKVLGHNVISDVHLGDIGSQAGKTIYEIEILYPHLPYFAKDYDGNIDFPFEITEKDLAILYPKGSQRSKEDELAKEKMDEITSLIQKGHIGYKTLWNRIVELSSKKIKESYASINVHFDLWNGELMTHKFIPQMIEELKKTGIVYLDDGAQIIDTTENIPPLILVKSDGSYLYSTTDLATIYNRVKNTNVNKLWYVVDKRQALHFKQVFIASKKLGLTENIELKHIGFGTMNSKDGKPFKTRDGGVLSLESLINEVKDVIREKTKNLDNKETLVNIISIGALKYADLTSIVSTDYIFDVDKFTSIEGKTGPYIMYNSVRIKSLIDKANIGKLEIENIENKDLYDLISQIIIMPKIFNSAFDKGTLHELCDYVYKINSLYSSFYSNNRILDSKNKKTLVSISKLVLKINTFIFKVLGIVIPDEM
ncbi:MAG: arginine--tRNA ligase [Bacilli bacterium]